MTGELVPRDDEAFGVVGVISTSIGVEFTENVSFEEWDGVGVALCQARDWSSWAIADWLAFGESHWPHEYADAQALTGRSYGGLRNLRWIGTKFPRQRRRPGLSWSHHRAVAGLDDEAEQDSWLDRAEAGAWSVDLLESALRDMRSLSSQGDTGGDPPAELAPESLGVEPGNDAASEAETSESRQLALTPPQGVDVDRLRRLGRMILLQLAETGKVGLNEKNIARLRRALGDAP